LLLPFPVNVYVRSLFRSLYLFLFEFQYRNWCELTRLIGSGPCVWEPLWLYGYIQSPGGHLSDATDSAIVSFSLAPIRFRIEANILPANCNFNLNWIELRQLLHSLIFQLIYAYLMHHPLPFLDFWPHMQQDVGFILLRADCQDMGRDGNHGISTRKIDWEKRGKTPRNEEKPPPLIFSKYLEIVPCQTARGRSHTANLKIDTRRR